MASATPDQPVVIDLTDTPSGGNTVVARAIMGWFVRGWLAENATNRQTGFMLIRNHFQFGVILTGLIVMRGLWRMSHRPPQQPPGEPP